MLKSTNARVHGYWQSHSEESLDGIATKLSLIEVLMLSGLAEYGVGMFRTVLGPVEPLLGKTSGEDMTHDALEFEITNKDGTKGYLTADFSMKGVSTKWGRFTKVIRIKTSATIEIPVESVLGLVSVYRSYNFKTATCKTYAAEKYGDITSVDPRRRITKSSGAVTENTDSGTRILLTSYREEKTNGKFSTAVMGPGLESEVDHKNQVGLISNPHLGRVEVSHGGVHLGAGLNAKTGVSTGKHGISAHLLGFGLALGKGGGISTPVLDLTFGPKKK